jgi:hypothetical protein
MRQCGCHRLLRTATPYLAAPGGRSTVRSAATELGGRC